MSEKIIYPCLIIIFSVLIIYFILTNKNNIKLKNNIENFSVYNEEALKYNIKNNNIITNELADGDWTSIYSKVDSHYNVDNLMTIDTKKKEIKIEGIIGNITLITDLNITAQWNVINRLNIHINFGDKDIQEKLHYKTDNPVCIVSIFNNDSLLYKYASYKVYNKKVDKQLYNIIKSQDIFIDQPPPIYDYPTYKTILGDYKFNTNYIYTSGSITGSSMFQKIQNDYFNNNIQFSIQRVFESPTGNEIITKNSPPIKLTMTSSIPKNINIVPFSNDKNINGLISFFKPKSTILYLYKIFKKDTIYDFSNLVDSSGKPCKSSRTDCSKSLNKSTLNDALKLQNKANEMFRRSIIYNDLNTIEQVNNNTYKLELVGTFSSNLNDPTIIPFEKIYSKL